MTWLMNIDGAFNKNGVRIGIMLENLSGVLIEEAVRLDEKITKNEAEYKDLLYNLELALRFGVQHLKTNMDSKMLLGQLVGTFEVNDSRMKSYRNITQSLMTDFMHVKVEAIRR